MSEVHAINKYPCPACGAEAMWNPAKNQLSCPYCGTVSEATLKDDGSLVAENDLVAALQSLPDDQRGWQAEKKTVKCQSCQAISVFDEKRVAQRCDFCGSAAMMAIDDIKAPIRPAGLLPFFVADTAVREQIRKWYGSHWFAPNNLKTKAMTDQLHGIYVPYWTFDAHVHAVWEAEAGHYYYTTNSKGERQRQIRWQHANGELQHFFDDLLVPASRGVHEKLLAQLEPFPTTDKIKPYDPGYVSGWVVEQYQIDLVAAAQASRNRMNDLVYNMCSRQVPGDTQRNLRVQGDFSRQTFKHVLLPVWLLTYNYGAKTFQVTVNGYTGKIAGEYPLSWVKIMLVVLAVVIVILIWASTQ